MARDIPKNEGLRVTVTDVPGNTYYITFKESTGFYFLYRKCEDGLMKLGRDENPIKLEQKYIKPQK